MPGLRTPGGPCVETALEAQAAACAAFNGTPIGAVRFTCVGDSVTATGFSVLPEELVEGVWTPLPAQGINPPLSACVIGEAASAPAWATVAEAVVSPVGALQLALVCACVFALLMGYRAGDRL